MPTELDPEVLRMFAVLFERSSSPQNYLYQLQQFYQACHDFRLLGVLADLRSDRLESVRRLGKSDAAYRKLTFHKTHLEEDQHVDAVLFGPGHPLFGLQRKSWMPGSSPGTTSK